LTGGLAGRRWTNDSSVGDRLVGYDWIASTTVRT
jgi:hypothetical protein